MMRYLTLIEVLELHRRIIEQSGGASGIRDFGLLESAIAQPKMMFGGEELYPSLAPRTTLASTSLSQLSYPVSPERSRRGHLPLLLYRFYDNDW